MEVDAAVNIFSRSEEKYGLRYTKYIGDGDSKGYCAVVEAKVYGDDVTIEKHECIGHIQKRMSGRLRKLRKEYKKVKLSDGKSLSGKNRHIFCLHINHRRNHSIFFVPKMQTLGVCISKDMMQKELIKTINIRMAYQLLLWK